MALITNYHSRHVGVEIKDAKTGDTVSYVCSRNIVEHLNLKKDFFEYPPTRQLKELWQGFGL